MSSAYSNQLRTPKLLRHREGIERGPSKNKTDDVEGLQLVSPDLLVHHISAMAMAVLQSHWRHHGVVFWSLLEWDRSNLVAPPNWPKPALLNRGFRTVSEALHGIPFEKLQYTKFPTFSAV